MSSTIEVYRGAILTVRRRVDEDGAAKNLTGYTVKLGVKVNAEDTEYAIGPISGTIDSPATAGLIRFAITATHTQIDPFEGVYDIGLYDGAGAKTIIQRGAFTVLREVLVNT